ncbi:MAG: MMPL family transporter [Clostridia bacterium]|nr:MMPL family transporter [Clostridia bacterium]
MERFGIWVAKHRVFILIMAVILAIPAGYSALQTELNYDILTYLPQDVASVQGQKIMDESFGSSDSGILVIKDAKEYRVKALEEKIEALEGVESVVWARDLVDISVPREILPDEIQDLFYRDDAYMLMVNFVDSAASDLTQESVIKIREIVHEEEGFLAGASAIIRDVIDLSNDEKSLYIGLAVLLALIILALTLPSTVIPILFLLGIGFGVLFNMGTNFFLKDVSYVTSAIAGVLQLGVTMDFSIFLYHRYEEERDFHDHETAMGKAISKTAVSISGAALTTIAGFLALTTMQLTLGANIGIVMAKGVFLGVICTLTIMPALLLVFDKVIHRFSHKTVLPSFEKISKIVVKKHVLLMLFAILLIVPAYYGSTHKDVYYKLDNALPRDMESIVALEEMKDTFDMKSIYFLAVNNDVKDIEVQNMINELENVQGINHVLGYQSVVGQMLPKSMLPESILEAFISDDFTKIILMSQYSAATDEANEQTSELADILKRYDENALLTGEVPMTKDLIEVTDRDIKVVNIVSVILLLIIIGVTFKSLSLPIILVTGIELAVLINMAVPFYFDQTIPFIASIVIGSIQLGTTVDYAILLTNRYKEELEYLDKYQAMEKAIKSSAKSIVTSGLTFFGSTFAVAMVSDIDMISSLSMMIGRGALISMIIIMILLPALLLALTTIISKTTLKWPKAKKNNAMFTERNSVN